MKKSIFSLAILWILGLTGCASVRDFRDISHQRVVHIQVTVQTPAGTLRRCYTSPEQIHRVLHTLRLEKNGSHTARANQKLRLELCCADGSRKRYYRLHPTEALLSVVWSTPGQSDSFLSPTDPPRPDANWHRFYFPALQRCPIPYK